MNSLPKAIIFDWDNTLVESMGMIHRAANHTLQHFNKPPMSLEQVKENAHQSPQDSFKGLFGENASQDEINAATAIFYGFIERVPIKERFDVLPGAAKLLQKLHTQAMPLGIVSNKKSDLLRDEVVFSGLGIYFQVVIGAGDAPQDKPSPDPLLLALRQMLITPSKDIWFVGDSRVDWACARAGGCQPISIHVLPGDDAIPYMPSFEHLEEIIGIPLQTRLSAGTL